MMNHARTPSPKNSITILAARKATSHTLLVDGGGGTGACPTCPYPPSKPPLVFMITSENKTDEEQANKEPKLIPMTSYSLYQCSTDLLLHIASFLVFTEEGHHFKISCKRIDAIPMFYQRCGHLQPHQVHEVYDAFNFRTYEYKEDGRAVDCVRCEQFRDEWWFTSQNGKLTTTVHDRTGKVMRHSWKENNRAVWEIHYTISPSPSPISSYHTYHWNGRIHINASLLYPQDSIDISIEIRTYAENGTLIQNCRFSSLNQELRRVERLHKYTPEGLFKRSYQHLDFKPLPEFVTEKRLKTSTKPLYFEQYVGTPIVREASSRLMKTIMTEEVEYTLNLFSQPFQAQAIRFTSSSTLV